MQPELLALVEALLDVGADIKKGLKAGGVVAALLADAELLSKLEIVGGKLSALPTDVKSLALADVPALLQVIIPGVEKIIAA